MTALIRNGAPVADDWQHATPEQELAPSTLPPGKLIVSLACLREHAAVLAARGAPLGVRLASHEEAGALEGLLEQLALVAIDFPAFTDGRGFSTARILREELGFSGEIRAVGDIWRDQIFLLHRCGFDSFALRADQDVEGCIAALGDFSQVYQHAGRNLGEPLVQRG